MKKTKSLILVPILALAFGMNVCAAGSTQIKTEDGSASCLVSAVVESTYSVSLPATLSLTKQSDTTYTCTYNVGGKGNITQKQYISIVPDSTFEMTGMVNGKSKTANVSQTVTKWRGRAVPGSETDSIQIGTSDYATSTGTVTVTLPEQADKYDGSFNFTYSLITESGS